MITLLCFEALNSDVGLLRASKKDRLRSGKVGNVTKDLGALGASSCGLEGFLRLPLQRSLKLIRRLCGIASDFVINQASRSPSTVISNRGKY